MYKYIYIYICRIPLWGMASCRASANPRSGDGELPSVNVTKVTNIDCTKVTKLYTTWRKIKVVSRIIDYIHIRIYTCAMKLMVVYINNVLFRKIVDRSGNHLY